MKLLISSLLFFSSLSFANNQQNNIGSPPNAATRGSDTYDTSGAPAGLTEEEKQEERARAESMGGASNVGVGTGTGTGAGSTVGHPIRKGTVTAGSTSGETED